jgi:hypothetical protein
MLATESPPAHICNVLFIYGSTIIESSEYEESFSFDLIVSASAFAPDNRPRREVIERQDKVI